MRACLISLTFEKGVSAYTGWISSAPAATRWKNGFLCSAFPLGSLTSWVCCHVLRSYLLLTVHLADSLA